MTDEAQHPMNSEANGQGNVVLLAELLATLPETEREVLVLRHWKGWPLAKIAKHTGRTPAAVAGLLHQGLKRVAENR